MKQPPTRKRKARAAYDIELDAKLLAIAKYLVMLDAEMSIRIQMHGANDPKCECWTNMRQALGLFGWERADEVVPKLRSLIHVREVAPRGRSKK